jgi:hypothetical protein
MHPPLPARRRATRAREPAPSAQRDDTGSGSRNACFSRPARRPEAVSAHLEFYAALWIGVLLVAGGAAVDAFPDDLDELARAVFLRLRPAAKA